MQILERRLYRGPNLYALYPVLRLRIDLGELEDYPTVRLPGFTDRLLELMPTLADHTCSYGTAGGFVRRMTEDDGTWLGHVMEHIAIELQCLAGTEVTYGKTRQHHLPRGQYFVIYEIGDEAVGMAAADLACDIVRHLLPADRQAATGEPLDYIGRVEELARLAERKALGPSTASLVRAAEERDIPWMRLDDYSLVQFGHGKYQRRIQATVTSETRQIAVEIASDKETTNQLLDDLGLPVPHQRLVYELEDARAAADSLGYPVVVKPLDANHGKGISIGLTDADQVAAAFVKAQEFRRAVLVETLVPGEDHRILVIDGRVVACAQRLPGQVVGDGERTIAQLVERVNEDPRRGVGHEKVLTRLEIDDQAQRLLALADLTVDSVLPDGEVFRLRSTGNLSTGGTAIDMTDVLHYDNRIMAERAVRAIGLDVGGVDFITPDVSRSWREVGGAIVEVNAAPGFRMHVSPSEGKPRDVAGPVMDMLFPPHSPARVPIAAITGTNGKTTTTRMVAHIMQLAGYTVGVATSDGVYVNGELLVPGDMTGPWSAKLVLRDPTIDCAVLETARGGMLREGLGWRRADVGAVLNVAADHLGIGGVESLEDLAEVKQLIAEVSQRYVVLNADDPLVAKMTERSAAKPILTTMDPGNRIVRDHVRGGGRAVVCERGVNGDMISFYEGEKHVQLLWTHLIPATIEGHAKFNVANAMAAAGVAAGMGVPLETIRQGLRTFNTTFYQTPGRLNFFDELPFRVLLDYAHNPHAFRAMSELIGEMLVAGRRLGVVGAPGDRRDEDIVRCGQIAGGMFDAIFVREDDNPRGRARGEVAALLRRGAEEAGLSPDAITVMPYEPEAVAAALEQASEGDLLVVLADEVSRTWKQIVYHHRDDIDPLTAPDPTERTQPATPPLFRPMNDRPPREGED